ncbi:hypothetical protein F441_16031 [Phytophthora nicotianae CJ01A1]|uniref:Uncharacterized protein n=1 Tax=Phytophthora nicotianae CJ01A1 TaxID=1317063 RepID=W2WB89_PHYNI|nr:hypothetical protein F441_16031 [Phytophthora nicotianae CJ01A1]
MEEELKRWALHDCSAFRDTLVPDEMKRLFERFRATRGKHVMVTPTETIRSLDRAWTAFKREADHARLSVDELAGQVCRLSREQGRRCCTTHFEDGWLRCRELGVARPDCGEWRRIVEAVPVTEVERDIRHRCNGCLVRRHAVRNVSEEDVTRHSSYPAWGPTSAPSSAAVRESYWCGVERRDPWVERGDLRAPEYGRQYGEHAPPYQQVAPDRHVRTEDQRGWEDAPEMRRLHQRLEILERENQTCVIGCSGSATSGEIARMRARRVHRVDRDDRRVISSESANVEGRVQTYSRRKL